MKPRARWQKFALGIGFLVVAGVTAYHAIDCRQDLTATGVLIGSIATGLGVIVWGNVQEHRAYAAQGKDGAA